MRLAPDYEKVQVDMKTRRPPVTRPFQKQGPYSQHFIFFATYEWTK